jgi:hypothetical protein
MNVRCPSRRHFSQVLMKLVLANTAICTGLLSPSVSFLSRSIAAPLCRLKGRVDAYQNVVIGANSTREIVYLREQ